MKKLMFVGLMVKCGGVFEVRTEFLNNTYLDELRLQKVKHTQWKNTG
jgi:hypothetical protein